MFRNRFARRSGHQRSRGELGLLLLALQVMQVGIDNIPIVTLLTLIANCAIYLHFPPDFIVPVGKACVGFTQVWYLKEWQRLFLSPWYHTSDMHLYYNMSSLIWKGRKLENRFGPIRFTITLLSFVVISPVITIALSYAAAEILEDISYLSQCAAGFSGVLFALKVLMSYYDASEGSYSRVLFLTVPTRAAFWFELVLIQILVPNVSFVGHLAGILTGLLYVKGPLKYAVKTISRNIEFFWYGGPPRQYFNNSGTTGSGYSAPRYQGRNDSNNYANRSPYTAGMSESDQMDWAMRDSMSSQRPEPPRQRAPTNRVYPDLSGYNYNQEPSAPPEEDLSPGGSSSTRYPDIGFVRQQRLNRYS